eukprot:364888-Chlamydomonas_euryale.AAC.2
MPRVLHIPNPHFCHTRAAALKLRLPATGMLLCPYTFHTSSTPVAPALPARAGANQGPEGPRDPKRVRRRGGGGCCRRCSS